MSDPVVLLSTGDVVGPAGGVTDNSMVLFSGTSGKLIKGNNAVVTAAGLALLDDVNAAAQRATLGLGTAATADVTTSATDGAAGRVMKVGDFGLGQAVGLGAANNIDQYTRSGFYTCDLVAGTLPAAGSSGGHLTVSGNGAGVAVQCFVPYFAPTRSFIRTWVSPTWTTWREIASTDSPAFIGTPTAPTASAGTSTTQIATTAFVAAAEKLNAPITTVAAAGTINLTTGAPNTSQLAISGTGVSINGFTVEASRFFVVKMTSASNTLVNSASLITGRGANIPVVAGDSFLMRSTAANTVEIVGGNFLIDRAAGSGQAWQDLTASRALGVTYTNTTGRTIVVRYVSSANAAITATVGAAALPVTIGAVGGNLAQDIEIPPYMTYMIQGGVISSWWELR